MEGSGLISGASAILVPVGRDLEEFFHRPPNVDQICPLVPLADKSPRLSESVIV